MVGILDPKNDGIDHINVYSKGQTELGRFLSNFTYAPILTHEGNFDSIEGYWYYLLAPDDSAKDLLKGMSGFAAKKYGRSIGCNDWPKNDDLLFQAKITKAITIKISASDKYFDVFKDNKLPFAHYYVYNNIINEPKDGKWILEFLESLRISLQ